MPWSNCAIHTRAFRLFVWLFLALGLQPVNTATSSLMLTSTLSQRIFVQNNHTFAINCTASGQPAPNITWLKDGVVLKPSKELRIDENGQLNFVNGVSDVGTGTFRCRARNSAGVLMTKKVELEVIYLENISVILSSSVVGYVARLECKVSSNQPVQFTWFKDGKILKPTSNPRITVLPSGVLQIRDYKPYDDGQYFCRAQNEYEQLKSPKLRVSRQQANQAAGLQIFPKRTIAATVGSPLVIECVDFGSKQSNLTWTKISPLPLNNSVLGTGENSVNLVFDHVRVSDSGEYLCAAERGVREKVVVSVQVPPSFELKMPATLELSEGNNLTLKCNAMGNPTPSVMWYRNGEPLVDSGRVHIHQHYLIVHNITVMDTGVYQCEAENVLGSSVTYTVLDVTGKEMQFIIDAYPLSATEINVTWSSTGISVVHYRVVTEMKKIEYLIPNQATFYTIADLRSFTEYIIYVTQYLLGKPTAKVSNKVRVTTREKVPTAPPLFVSLKSYSYGTLDVTWLPPHPSERNGLITGYNISYSLQGDSFRRSILVGENVYILTLKGLTEGRYYHVKVAAETRIGLGPFSNEKLGSVSRKPGEEVILPAPVIAVKVVDSSVLVKIEQPIRPGVAGYLLQYRNIMKEDEQNKTFVIEERSFSKTLSDLDVNSEYVIYVKATATGTVYGRPAVVVIATKKELPESDNNKTTATDILPPMEIACYHDKRSTALFLKWKSPPFDFDTEYRIKYFVANRPEEARNISTKSLNATLPDLSPGTQYYVGITSVVRVGSKPHFSKEKVPDRKCISPEERPGTPPSNVTCHAGSPSGIIVRWRAPVEPNGKITRYRIKWSDLDKTDREEELRPLDLLNSYSKHLTNVKRDSKYTVLVYAENSAGVSSAAQCSIDTTMVKDVTSQAPSYSMDHNSVEYDDVKLGIIIGCIISLLFVAVLVMFILWTDPCGCRSHKPLRRSDAEMPVQADSRAKTKRISKPDTISTEVSDASSKHFQILQKYFFEEASKESDRGLGMTPKNSRLCLDSERLPFLPKAQQQDYSADGSFDSQDSGIQGFNKLDKGSQSSNNIAKDALTFPYQSKRNLRETVC